MEMFQEIFSTDDLGKSSRERRRSPEEENCQLPLLNVLSPKIITANSRIQRKDPYSIKYFICTGLLHNVMFVVPLTSFGFIRDLCKNKDVL